ncbi:MAG: CBS domain-containing protein [Candidatus Helarchaeota archaeon]
MTFDLSKKENLFEEISHSETRFYQVFLCYFDETRGHLPLFTYPLSFKNDEKELKIIKIHSIWFLDTKQEDLQHVDLEFGEKIYLAMKFTGKSWREKARAGLTETTPETYVLILALPQHLAFLGTDLLLSLYIKIKELADQLYILIKKEMCAYKLIKNQKDYTIIEEGKVIEKELYKICKNLVPPIFLETDIFDNLVSANIEKNQKLAYLLYSELTKKKTEKPREFEIAPPSEKSLREKGIFKKPVKITNIGLIDNNQKLRVSVKNLSKDLHDVLIQITQVKAFFETSSWQTEVDTWFAGEELVFNYPISEIEEVGFQLRIKSIKDGALLLSKQIYPKDYLKERPISVLESTKIKDFMDPNPQTISYSANVKEAVKIMNSLQIDYVIVTFDETPIGIVTHRDILRKVINRCILRDNVPPNVIKCKDIMTKPLITVNEDDSIKKAALLIIQNQIKKLPVLKGNALRGIITTNDLINVFLKQKVQVDMQDEKLREIVDIKSLPVKNIMNANVLMMDFYDSCQKLLNTLLRRQVGSTLVQKNNKPVGIITERDILKKFIEEEREPRDLIVGDLMSSPVISITPDTKIYEAIELMIHKGIKYLPVADENNPYMIKGIISNTDIFNIDISKTSDF